MTELAKLLEKYEPVIGLEIHAQLSTRTKIFCPCPTDFGAEPNANTCAVCLGLPGALPVLNQAVVEKAIFAAFALNLRINEVSVFSRKNYFYPDLPKGYQISQYDQPFSVSGFVEIPTSERDETGRPTGWQLKRFRIQRMHIEEDAGKSLHEGMPDSATTSYVNLNRSGVPLVEIVSEPDFRSSWEAYDYVQYLRRALLYVDACDGNMEEGSLRCDANVSIRRRGSPTLGTRTETKNLNSFRFIQRAIDYEIARQVRVLEEGGRIVQETRLWNEREGRTYTMRSKEEAHDYRYFPEPDLPPLVITAETIAALRAKTPELPEPRRRRFAESYGLSLEDSSLMTTTREIADFFEACVEASGNARAAFNWIANELLARVPAEKLSLSTSPVTPAALAELIALIADGTLSNKLAKDVFERMLATGKPAKAIVQELGGGQVSDVGQIEAIAHEVIAGNPKQTAEYRAGKTPLFAFFVGQVMKATKGKANPQVVNDVLKRLLDAT
ncbi:MAG: Asp-tRNA(Asn)/Glu-tRNA(Gln) amidotransferase subunit GatB [Chloracidobacterium sp.]|uniref:Aspartyl/glutamyl-tRNA(Asn/Gln) amidotransferase subunit B n=1 Tax=Chloracidobacterium validum TaxID=2821543 RepID=A0ABX8B641_9BACT|nr:Asp-tRNA(Asn)/Glu-tRNA(Gln) amidotransferase subunit GatB [Chloracidobacterium validum]QUW02437.1 Asp-tRNA(Asn)/Glu-tRNA(Gln) amidotransferase subunit GatB [Chloracidobacterium validum]